MRSSPIKVDKYLVHGELSRDTWWRTFSAFDPALGRRVVLHLLRADVRLSARHARSIEQRLKAIAKVANPRLLAVHDAGYHEGLPFVAREEPGGTPLPEWLTTPRSTREVLRIMLEVGEALHELHADGLAHGRVSVANLFVTADGFARLGAFRLSPEPDPDADARAYALALSEALQSVGDGRVPWWVVSALQPRPQLFGPSPDLERLIDRLTWGLRVRAPRTRTMGFTLLVALLVVAGGWLVMRANAVVCGGGPAELERAFGPQVRDPLARALGERGAVLLTHLDAYAAAWLGAHRGVCLDALARKDPPEALDLKMACLLRRRAELVAVVGALRTGAVSAQRTGELEMLSALTPVEVCRDLEALKDDVPVPDAPDLRRSVEEVRAELARVDALLRGRRHPEAAPIARRALERAVALRFPPLTAEARVRLAQAERDSDYVRAERSFREALKEGLATNSRAVVAEALIGLTWVVGHDQQRTDDGLQLAEDARAALEALGRNDYLRERLLLSTAAVYAKAGRHDEALALYEEARTGAERGGADSPRHAAAINLLIAIHLGAERYELVPPLVERALGIFERTLGPENAEAADLLNNLGMALTRLGRLEEGKAAFERALRLSEREDDGSLPRAATLHTNLAWVHAAKGSLVEARRYVRRAVQIAEAALPADHPVLLQALESHGAFLLMERRFREAQPILLERVRHAERVYGPTSPRVLDSLYDLAQAYVELRQPDDALPLLERCLRLIPAGTPAPLLRGGVRINLAQALWLRGERPGRVLALAREARTYLATLPPPQNEIVKEVDAFTRRVRRGIRGL